MIFNRFSIMHRMMIVTIIVAVVLIFAITGLTHLLVMAGMMDIQKNAAINCTEHVFYVLQSDSDTLSQTISEWASVHETRALVADNTAKTTLETVTEKDLQSGNINFLLIYNASGQLVSGLNYDIQNSSSALTPGGLDRVLRDNHLIGPESSQTPKSGLLALGDLPLEISTHPVMPEGEMRYSQGTIVGGRILNAEAIGEMSSHLRETFSISVIKSSYAGPEQSGLSTMGPAQAEFDEVDDQIIINRTMTDVSGKPVFLVTMQVPLVNPYHDLTLTGITLIIIFGLGLFILVIYLDIRYFFLRHIRSIGEELKKAASSGRSVETILADMPPDLTNLADSAKQVLSTLDQKDKYLTDSEHQRKAAEIRWETLFSNAAEVIIIGDEQGVLICNPRFEELTGIPSVSMVGKKPAEFPICSDIGDGCTNLDSRWVDRGQDGDRFIWQFNEENGNEILLDVNIRFIESDGRRLRFLIARDITEEIRLKNEQDLAVRQIDKNLAQLAALNDEIRNPLTMIMGYTDLDAGEHQVQILGAIDRIDKIVDNLDKGFNESEKVRNFLMRSLEGFRPK